LAEAIKKDLGKPRFEVFLTEINVIAQRSITCATCIAEWAKDEDMSPFSEDWQAGWTSMVRKNPKGVVLIIAYVILFKRLLLLISFLKDHGIIPSLYPFNHCMVLLQLDVVR